MFFINIWSGVFVIYYTSSTKTKIMKTHFHLFSNKKYLINSTLSKIIVDLPNFFSLESTKVFYKVKKNK